MLQLEVQSAEIVWGVGSGLNNLKISGNEG